MVKKSDLIKTVLLCGAVVLVLLFSVSCKSNKTIPLETKESNYNSYLEKNEKIDIETIAPEFKQYISVGVDSGIDTLTAQKIIKKKFDANTEGMIVIIKGTGKYDTTGGFAVFKKTENIWKLIQTESIGEYVDCDTVRFVDLTSRGSDEMVVEAVYGAHSHDTIIYRFFNGAYKRVLISSSNGTGINIIKNEDKYRVIDFVNSLIEVPESWQIYHEREYKWNGKEFVAEEDELGKIVSEYERVEHKNLGKSYNVFLMRFDSYLQKHPDDFAALADCSYIGGLLKNKEKKDYYLQRLLKQPINATECEHCDEKTADWIIGNKRNYIRILSEQ